jgi:uncharacterized phage-associated protein
MAVSVHDVARELRARHPDIGKKKLHKLLYYCQGHHLAHFGRPLFTETISAWDMGPVVGTLWKQEDLGQEPPPPAELNEGELNTIGFVLHRYGALTGGQLERLSHSEVPWKRADDRRSDGGRSRIEPEWIRDFFQAAEAADEDQVAFDPAQIQAMLAGVEERSAEPSSTTSLEDLRARRDALARGA